ncbi:helicase-exonuclease AddAB subunit AddA [Bacillus sp. FJAT-49732]|uniref:ATP-dependent helicase/nuclease subunit A n=1 Tax=Lederbergia citrisecunda TaxID=2833583 RepID=A0A942TMF4_9BACI|nr:helicase-exonuclease AddAB subunit AddA [Lederbergia citrisecunda]MBS4198652.1 helicase-exonuclease AddAB subunit AddA [Lederbergia citrisecunda]
MKTVIPIKPEHVTWTDDQWKAIMAKDQDILVAAAAGSGKTAVLVERIIQKILAVEDPLNIDELLVVTFTNASAAEMRHRIGEALEKAIDEDPLSTHLRRQLSLLNSASISTLHSFCLDVVRKYYYMIDIDPGFRIADQTEADLLRDEVIDELFENEYGKQGNESFYRFVDTFSNDRHDGAVQELVLKLYDFSRSHPNPFMWLDQIVEMYDVTENTKIENLPFIDILKFDIQLQLSGAKELLQQALEISKTPGGPAPRAENYLSDLSIIERMEDSAVKGWDFLYETMKDWSFSRAKTCRGDEYDPALIKEADDLRKTARGMLDKLSADLFSKSPEKFLKDMQEMKQVLATLVEVVKQFSHVFEKEKADRGLVDFSDLEHLCLQVLIDRKEGTNDIIPSEISHNYRNQFREVLVDEYQDTNMVQETIINLVSADGESDGNLFMVGDVKQSIYLFRLAEPILFLGKYLRFTSEGENTGLRIDLSRNFRSRAEVLDGVNFIFKQIMGTKVGEIEYNRDAELVKGSGYPNEEDFPIEIGIIDQSDKDLLQEEVSEDAFDLNELEQTKLEARYMAEKIRRMIDEENPIYELKTKNVRPIRYKDVVILVRSLSWAPDIMEEFKLAGIPAHVNLSTGYFEATEVSIMMSLLKIIDNPDQDIPFAAVLRSPIIGLSEEELAHIRLQSRRGSYYGAVKTFIANMPDHDFSYAWEQVSHFINQLHEWRTMARSGALSELIWQLYRDTGFYEFVGGLPGGKQRQANLRAFYDRARQYENTSFRGLFRFLRFIERMRERGNDLGAARALGEQEDVVRIMTIHSSKGLEFPVVFVAGIGRQFNMKDLISGYMFDKEFGFACKYVNPEKRISYSSLPQLALRRKKKMEMLSEEMRVLYVALTRAKEKLFLVGSVKNIEKEMKKWMKAASQSEWLLSDHDRAQANSYLDWIGLALVRHRDGDNILEVSEMKVAKEILEHPSRWKVSVLSQNQFDEDIKNQQHIDYDWQESVKKGNIIESESENKQEVFSRLSWEYAYPQSTKRMSKQSVSEIKRMFEMRDEASGTQIIQKNVPQQYDRPKFMIERGVLSPAERGTAMHTVMQHIPLDEQPTLFSVEMLLEDLIEKEIITIEQAEVVSCDQIVHFFESEIGQRMISAKKVHREVPFTLGLPAQEVYSDWDGFDENVLVQGIIDCIIEEKDGVILLDYKTDVIQGRFPNGFQQAKRILSRRYETQLSLYGRAIIEIWDKPVIGKYLYFFDGGEFLKL